jgi:hypothetical protein
MQTSFEKFTVQGMFAVVAQAVKLLTNLTIEDMIYTPEGLIDAFKIQTILATQQHTMNILQQFNTHVRQLPGTLMDMLYSVERQSIIEIQSSAVEVHDAESTGGNVSSKSMAQLLIEAETQLKDNPVEQADEYVEPIVNKEDIESVIDVDDDNTPIEL